MNLAIVWLELGIETPGPPLYILNMLLLRALCCFQGILLLLSLQNTRGKVEVNMRALIGYSIDR